MAIKFYSGITGNQYTAPRLSTGLVAYMAFALLLSGICVLATALATSLAKMQKAVFILLAIFTCIIFSPKPFTVKGFGLIDNCIQISITCKIPVLLKPFIRAYLAVSKFGRRQAKAVYYIVSLPGANALGMRAWGPSHSGKMRQANRCLILSHFFAGLCLPLLQLPAQGFKNGYQSEEPPPSDPEESLPEKPPSSLEEEDEPLS